MKGRRRRSRGARGTLLLLVVTERTIEDDTWPNRTETARLKSAAEATDKHRPLPRRPPPHTHTVID